MPLVLIAAASKLAVSPKNISWSPNKPDLPLYAAVPTRQVRSSAIADRIAMKMLSRHYFSEPKLNRIG